MVKVVVKGIGLVARLGCGGISGNVPEKQQAKYKQYCALSQVGTPEEVGEWIAFLLSLKKVLSAGRLAGGR
jgi:hypothetical protein